LPQGPAGACPPHAVQPPAPDYPASPITMAGTSGARTLALAKASRRCSSVVLAVVFAVVALAAVWALAVWAVQHFGTWEENLIIGACVVVAVQAFRTPAPGQYPPPAPMPLATPLASVPLAEEDRKEAWTPEERSCISAMLEALERDGVPPPPEELLLQVAWSRKLKPEGCTALWKQHLEAISHLDIAAVSDEAVMQAYNEMGFCERCGQDVDGRPMIWVRMALCDVAKLTPSMAVKNTWLAQDATLCGSEDANRRGLCFVYDLRGVGLKNVTFNVRYLRAAIWGATSHPMHISRVWLVDAPNVFLAAWRLGQGLLPAHVRQNVHFLYTGERDVSDCLGPICEPGELPPYLGGDANRFGNSYAEWMFKRLKGQPLAYQP